MAPNRKEQSDRIKNLTMKRHKDGKGYKKISNQLKISGNTVPAVIMMYRMSHSTTDQSCSGRLPKILQKLGRRKIFQHDNNPKHKFTQGFL
uniref:Transposase IS30-like HTH domain-containing protein n=1 Tax=Amphiprion ocellaris TaxID=80972 RepID=A0AAQ5ZB93_AMPOC